MAEVAEIEDAPAIDEGEIQKTLRIPVVKAGKGYFVDVAIDDQLPMEMFRNALYLGLKQMVNSRMSKLASTKDLTGKELEETRAAIMAKATENVSDMYENKLRKAAAAKEKSEVPQAVMAEARRIAKIKIKDAKKKEGVKVSLIPAKTLTAAANKLIADPDFGPKIIAMAKKNLAERDKDVEAMEINTKGLELEEDAGLKAKAEARTKSRRKPSKSEDGEEATAPKARGKGRAEAHA